MVSCSECFYCAKSAGNKYIVCRFFNRVINVTFHDGCSSYKGKVKKFGLKRELR